MIQYKPGQKIVFIDPGAEEDETSYGVIEETPDQYDGFYLIDVGDDELLPILPTEILYAVD